jgi:hypothetical protein
VWVGRWRRVGNEKGFGRRKEWLEGLLLLLLLLLLWTPAADCYCWQVLLLTATHLDVAACLL